MTQLSRADLLRAIHQAGSSDRHLLAKLLGFGRDAPDQPSPPTAGQTGEKSNQQQEQEAEDTGVQYLAHRPVTYWYVAKSNPLSAETTEQTPSDTSTKPSKALPFIRPKSLPPAPLLSAGDWQNHWDKLLLNRTPGRQLDLSMTSKQLARAKPLNRLPRRHKNHFCRQALFLFERGPATRPVWQELGDAVASLTQLLGEPQLAAAYTEGSPQGPWFDAQTNRVISLQGVVPDTHILLCVRFAKAGAGQPIDTAWREFIKHWQCLGHPLSLLSLYPVQAPGLAMRALQTSRQTAKPVAQQLLAALALTWRPSLGQLRRLRRAIPGCGLDAELAVYNHPDVRRSGETLDLAAEAIPRYQKACLEAWSQHKTPLNSAIAQWQISLGGVAREAEALQRELTLSIGPSDPPNLADYPRLQKLAAQAETEQQQPDRSGTASDLLRSLLPLGHRLASHRHQPQVQALLRVMQQVARSNGERLPLAHHDQREGETRQWLWPSRRGLQLGDQPHPHALLELGEQPYDVASGKQLSKDLLQHQSQLEIIDRLQHWALKRLTKPTWAERIWQSPQGLHAAHQDGSTYQLLPAQAERPSASWQCIDNTWPWASDTGIDDYGLWAECRVKNIAFRLRWIPAGSFMMGSPLDEHDRKKYETPHKVTLTQGFWLGETTVTQGLWRVVMGKNPAHFQGEQRPVEQVSWDDAQPFIAKLNEAMPGLGLTLPSEAQWEYACRAGTQTPFSFGTQLTTAGANYHGDYPYHDGPQGEDRRTTLPVKSFQPNLWGLYQMHGNVWEWCADWFGAYPTGPLTDPLGPSEGQERVLRGGSWNSIGRFLRSAYRGAYEPVVRYDFVGLRLAGGFDPQASAAGTKPARRERP